MTDLRVPERHVWALWLGEQIMRLAETSRQMGHSNPAATVMYVDPRWTEDPAVRCAAYAALDFAKWCSHGRQGCEEGARFLAFVDEITARDSDTERAAS